MNNTYAKLEPEFKAKWLEDLRSGKYKQTTGTLREYEYRPKYCCLGVLAEQVVAKGDAWWEGTTLVTPVDEGRPHLRFTTQLNTIVTHRVGLDERAQSRLVDMNDNEHRSFAEIADWIEENL